MPAPRAYPHLWTRSEMEVGRATGGIFIPKQIAILPTRGSDVKRGDAWTRARFEGRYGTLDMLGEHCCGRRVDGQVALKTLVEASWRWDIGVDIVRFGGEADCLGETLG